MTPRSMTLRTEPPVEVRPWIRPSLPMAREQSVLGSKANLTSAVSPALMTSSLMVRVVAMALSFSRDEDCADGLMQGGGHGAFLLLEGGVGGCCGVVGPPWGPGRGGRRGGSAMPVAHPAVSNNDLHY